MLIRIWFKLINETIAKSKHPAGDENYWKSNGLLIGVWYKTSGVFCSNKKNNYIKEQTHGGDPAGHENDSKSNGLLIRIRIKLMNETLSKSKYPAGDENSLK